MSFDTNSNMNFSTEDNELEDNNNNNNNNNFIDTFSFSNISLDYNFTTCETALFLNNSENQTELLYESSIVDGIKTSYFYSNDMVYILFNYVNNQKEMTSLQCISKKNLIRFVNLSNKDPKSIFMRKMVHLSSSFYMNSHSRPLFQNETYYTTSHNDHLLKDFKHLFIKYTASAALIPASAIINAFLNDVHQYISTGKFDISTLKRRINEIQHFKELCSSSIFLMTKFVENPSSVDLRNLCDSLEMNIKNIDNLVKMYLEDELSFKNEGERNDNK